MPAKIVKANGKHVRTKESGMQLWYYKGQYWAIFAKQKYEWQQFAYCWGVSL